MDNSRNDKVSPLTKILVGKVHDGRKQDSKFWQSEFSDSAGATNEDCRNYIAIEKPVGFDSAMAGMKARRSSIAVIFAVICALFAVVALRPDLFPFLTYSGIYKTISKAFPEKEKAEYQRIPQSADYDRDEKQAEQRSIVPATYSEPRRPPENRYDNSQSGKVKSFIRPQKNEKQWLSQKELDSFVTPEAPKKQPEIKVSEPTRTLYEIELYSGATIYTNNAMVSSDKVTYTSSKGLIVSINKYEVKSMKRMKVKL